MKKLLLLALVFVTLTAAAQKNTIVGRWSFISVSSPEFTFDLEQPEVSRKALVEQARQATGESPDSSQLEMAFRIMSNVFAQMYFEFDGDSTAIFTGVNEAGMTRSDTARYTIDYNTGTLVTVEADQGTEIRETVKIRFDGDYLHMEKPEKNEKIRLKRQKIK